jgi:hypothetical protein
MRAPLATVEMVDTTESVDGDDASDSSRCAMLGSSTETHNPNATTRRLFLFELSSRLEMRATSLVVVGLAVVVACVAADAHADEHATGVVVVVGSVVDDASDGRHVRVVVDSSGPGNVSHVGGHPVPCDGEWPVVVRVPLATSAAAPLGGHIDPWWSLSPLDAPPTPADPLHVPSGCVRRWSVISISLARHEPARWLHVPVSWTAACAPSAAPQLAARSCDRFLDDGDLSMWSQLGRLSGSDDRRPDATIHLGDQVYADAAVRSLCPAGAAAPSAAQAWARLRDEYRRAWSATAAQNVLRHGPHWFLPDDHDVVNNVPSAHIVLPNGHGGECRAVAAAAALRALAAYTLQSHRDVMDGCRTGSQPGAPLVS